MTTDRTATIVIGGDEYTLVLTTKATKEIAGRYGGLENLGDKLMKSENFEMAIGEIVWLITLLANQAILIHNLKHKDDPKELLTEDVDEKRLICKKGDKPYDLTDSHFKVLGFHQLISKVLKTAVATCDFLGGFGCKDERVFVTADDDLCGSVSSHYSAPPLAGCV